MNADNKISNVLSFVRTSVLTLVFCFSSIHLASSQNFQTTAHLDPESYAAVGDSIASYILINDMDNVRLWVNRISTLATDKDAYHSTRCIQAFLDLLEGRRVSAYDFLEEAIRHFANRTDSVATRALSIAYCTMGFYEYETGLDGADRFYRKAEQCAKVYDDYNILILCLFARGHMYLRSERYVEAAYCARQMLDMCKEHGSESVRFRAQLILFNTYSCINADAAAEDYMTSIEREAFFIRKPSAAIVYYQVVAEDRSRNHLFESALEFVNHALSIADNGNVSDVHAWQLHLLRASIQVSLKHVREAKEDVSYCRKHISVVDPQCSDGNYSRYNVDLVDSKIAILEGRFVDAETIMRNADFPSQLLQRESFVIQYNSIFEDIFVAEQDYTNARKILQRSDSLSHAFQGQHAQMRTKDMEIAFREDPTIRSQQTALASNQKDISDIESQIVLWILGAITLILLVGLFFLILRSRRRRQRQKHELEYNNRLQAEVEAKTAANVAQNKLLLLKNADIQASQTYARRLQRGILPPAQNLVAMGVSGCYVLRNSYDKLEGCFYWFRRVGDHVVVACADDVDGGVSGAMLSMVGVTVINDTIIQYPEVSSASDLLGIIDDRIVSVLPDSSITAGLEMSVAIIDLSLKTVSIASASQDSIMLVAGVPHVISPSPFLVGARTEHQAEFSDMSFLYNPGDELMLFTTSLIKSVGGDKAQELGLERFSDMAVRTSKIQKNLRNEAMLNELQLWSGGRRAYDFLLISIML